MRIGKKLLLVMMMLLLGAACGAEFEDDEYEDEADSAGEVSGEDENGCLPQETYDDESDTCGVDLLCDTEDECNELIASLYPDDEEFEFEYWEMEPEDCLPGELYDEREATCYIECDGEAECAAKAEEIYAGTDVYYNDNFAGHGDERGGQTSAETNAEPGTIATYSFDSNLNLELISADNDADPAQSNEDRHQEIWRFVSRILPKNVLRAEAEQYVIFTDGAGDTLAYVSPLETNKNRWLIAIDIVDTGTEGELGGEVGLQEFVHTVVHEFAHIVTIENDQVPPDTSLSAEQIEQGIESDVQRSCPNYYPGEGCAKAGSYINLFYQRFWDDIYAEFDESVNLAETEDEYQENLIAFYDKYSDRFVSEYAGTNPGEDIAESFTAFVLKDKPSGQSIADEKVRFFYQFDRLVQMRNYIRSQLARVNGS